VSDEQAEIVVTKSEEPVPAPVLVSFEESFTSDTTVADTSATTEVPAKSDSSVETASAVESEEAVEQENDPILSLPLATVEPMPIIEERPASSQPEEVDTAADGNIDAEDTDANAEDLSAEADDAAVGEYVDNIDSEIVDRSQDDLADDRPEVFLLPVSESDNTRLPEMQSAPRSATCI